MPLGSVMFSPPRILKSATQSVPPYKPKMIHFAFKLALSVFSGILEAEDRFATTVWYFLMLNPDFPFVSILASMIMLAVTA